MPEQFPYPEQGWSTGKMRMAKLPMDPGREYRELMGTKRTRDKETKASEAVPAYQSLGPNDWNTWFKDNVPNGGAFITNKKGNLRDELTKSPYGLTVPKDHPDLKGLGDDYEIHTIPQMEEHLLVRPKKTDPLTSEWQSEGGRVA